jgi:2,4-dienoyl-CoA reductase-like NADH-dependent reductase (Old Yellow Enzyme family)
MLLGRGRFPAKAIEENDVLPFRPIRIGPVTAPGRICRSATAEGTGDANGRPSESLGALCAVLAEGGAPWIVTGHAFVSPTGRCSARQNGIHDDALVPAWKAVVETVRRARPETRLFVQLSHGGRQVSAECVQEPIAPSPVPMRLKGVTPREMTPREIEETLSAFEQAARRASEAGFDGVQLHCAHGYLLSQFLSPHTNRRSDEWGGTPERRRRFVLEALRRVRRAVGTGVAVTVKLNGEDFVQDGFSLAESCEAARALAAEGCDAIEVSGFAADGNLRQTPMRKGDPKPSEEGYYLSQAVAIKRAAGTIPVGVCGGLRSWTVIQRILESDGLDFVALSRPFIAEPDIVRRFAAGQARATCITCNECAGGKAVPIHCPLVADGRLTPPSSPNGPVSVI